MLLMMHRVLLNELTVKPRPRHDGLVEGLWSSYFE